MPVALPDGLHPLDGNAWEILEIRDGRPAAFSSLGQRIPSATEQAELARRIERASGFPVRFEGWQVEPGDPRESGVTVRLVTTG